MMNGVARHPDVEMTVKLTGAHRKEDGFYVLKIEINKSNNSK